MILEHKHRELAWCERDIAEARARLAANAHDTNARRWLEQELSHRDRVLRYLAQFGVRP